LKHDLAEGLLAKVMGWDNVRMVEELPRLDRMARFKYDEYQQFGPGQKFLEALCLWLGQFETLGEREAAYAFVKDRLVFVSADDMRHLVEASYPDLIRSSIIESAAHKIGISSHRLTDITQHPSFTRALRSTLFLGLSDGSRMDVFRRSAGLDNEQVWQAYEISATKSEGMLKDLRRAVDDNSAKFERIVLIDDFSASGISYVRLEDGEWKGKAIKALKQFQPTRDAEKLVDHAKLEMHIVLYLATQAAVQYIQRELIKYCASQEIPAPKVSAVYELAPELALAAPADAGFLSLVDDDRYYRTRPQDEHEAKGGTTDMKLGFAGCTLPVVLAHNCPNNSVFLLWGDPLEEGSARGLFPRIVRHREVS
jgi:hypothetical protein